MKIEELTNQLLTMNVNNMTEEKNGLTYLSWASAWGEILKVVPNATYEVKMFDTPNGTKVPYCGDPNIGYMVFTSVTIEGLTRECYLPVMDNANKSMKAQAYSYKVFNKQTKQYDQKQVESMTMFDVNKAIMRCLAKNLAMFGLGLYIYKGEDLPDQIETPVEQWQIEKMKTLGVIIPNACKRYGVADVHDLTKEQANEIINIKQKALDEEKKIK